MFQMFLCEVSLNQNLIEVVKSAELLLVVFVMLSGLTAVQFSDVTLLHGS